MNEMRHVLTGLRIPAKSSTLSSVTTSTPTPTATPTATATWYDVPTPIIVHCREFREEAERDRKDEARNRKGPYERSQGEMGMRELVDEMTTAKSSERDVIDSKFDRLSFSPDSVDKAHRDSRAETVVSEPRHVQVNLAESRVNEKRRSTTMELNATTTVKTDADGVPTISFSFLRTDEKHFHDDDGDEILILEVDTSDQPDFSGNQLYDLPKSAIPESNRFSTEQPSRNKEINSGESSAPAVDQSLYDMPRATGKDVSLNETREGELPHCSPKRENYQVANSTIVSPDEQKQLRDRTKRSTRSLKCGRRSYGASDSDGYDAGIASMSGSYSDPECPPEEATLSESGGSERSKRLRLQKRRLGKAWGRMRSWLREERTRIGQVVNRHAKLQAVGALSPEVVP